MKNQTKTELKEQLKESVELIQYFVNRVEEGSIRSKKTYAKYKAFLDKIKSK